MGNLWKLKGQQMLFSKSLGWAWGKSLKAKARDLARSQAARGDLGEKLEEQGSCCYGVSSLGKPHWLYPPHTPLLEPADPSEVR